MNRGRIFFLTSLLLACLLALPAPAWAKRKRKTAAKPAAQAVTQPETPAAAAATAAPKTPAQAPAAAQAREAASKLPIQVTSDGPMNMRYGEGLADFSTHVQVHQGSALLLTCEKLTARFADQNTVESLTAETGVHLYNQDMEGTCERADYTVATDVFVMTGNPVIRKDKDRYTADKITIYRKDGRVVFEPSARLLVDPDQSKGAPFMIGSAQPPATPAPPPAGSAETPPKGS